jgi:hypothetical protein
VKDLTGACKNEVHFLDSLLYFDSKKLHNISVTEIKTHSVKETWTYNYLSANNKFIKDKA